MRVLLFCHTGMPPLYGTESVVDALGRNLTALGVETVVACCGAQAPLDGFSPPYDLRVFDRGRFRLLRKWRLERQLARLLATGFDIVHGHGALPEGEWLLSLKPRHRAPVVLTCHRPLRTQPTEEKQGTRKSRLAKFEKRLARRRRALAHADAVIGLSPSMGRSIADFCGRGEHVQPIPNGVRIPDSATASAALPAGLPAGSYVLGMGRLAREKGFDLLVRAFARAFGEQQDLNLVLAGDGPDAPALRRLGEDLGLGERLRLIGYVKEPVKTALLRGAAFLGVPSRVPETFCLVVLESFAVGRTVVGAATGGIPDLIRDQENGLVFPVDDEARFARAMGRLMDDDPFRSDLQERARATAEDFTWERVAQQHLALYRALLEKLNP